MIARADVDVDKESFWGGTDPFFGHNPKPHFPTSRLAAWGKADAAARNKDRKAFGRALHEVQDSFSHQGFGPGLGHSWAWWDPDSYNLRSSRDQKMRKTTQELIDTWKKSSLSSTCR